MEFWGCTIVGWKRRTSAIRRYRGRGILNTPGVEEREEEEEIRAGSGISNQNSFNAYSHGYSE